jgi:hypothetical protein
MGYKIIKLGDYIEYKPKSKRNASYADETGTKTFYTSSDKIKKCKECDFNDDELKLIFGDGGNGSLFIDKQFSCSDHNIVVTIKNKLLLLYLYYYIKNNWNDYIKKIFNGSVIKNLSKSRLNNYEIPIPINMETIKSELENLFKLHETINEINDLIEIKENDINEKIKDIIENVECDILKLGDICQVMNATKNIAIKKIDYIQDNKYIGFISGSDVSNNLDLPKYCITLETYNKSYQNTKCIIKTNDIIVSSCSKKFNYIKVRRCAPALFFNILRINA